MPNKPVNTNNAPAPIGPYSQAVRCGSMLFISGQIALVPGSDNLSNQNITEETRQVMNNLKAILNESEMDFADVVKTSIFLSDMSLFAEVNEEYAKYFTGNYPARETVAVKGLPKNVNVEISMIASREK